MDDSTRRWVSGCAIGCTVSIALVVLVIASGYLGVRKMVRNARQIEATMSSVRESFGSVTEFRPEPSGLIPADRVEAFLRVRELTLPERQRLEDTLAELAPADSSEPGALPHRLGSIRAGIGVVPQIMGYLNRRGEALLEAGMGLGEYLYIYTLTYPCLLGLPVDDGPRFVGSGRTGDWEVGNQGVDPELRRATMQEGLHRMLLPMLQHQLEDRTATGPAAGDDWAGQLGHELELMEQDPRRLPWQDGLPAQTAASLAPFRDRLEASYSSLCNPIEVAAMR